MSSRNEFDDFFDDDEPVDAIDTKPEGRLLRVPLTRMSPNLVNPRTNFGSPEELLDLGKSLARGQVQAMPVVSRDAYLKLWPENRERVGDVDVVIVCGERRYRGARAADLGALQCVLNDSHASSRRAFMEAVVSENVDRENFDPIEEAYAVHALVAEFGTNRAVAQHFERADGWVTQRVCLTYLDPSLHDLVRQKAIPLEDARKLGQLVKQNGWPADQQLAWWDNRTAERQQQAERKKAARSARAATMVQDSASPASPQSGVASRPTGDQPPKSFTAVKQRTEDGTGLTEGPSGDGGTPKGFTAVKLGAAAPHREASLQSDPGAGSGAPLAGGQAFNEALPGGQKLPEQRPDSTANAVPTAAAAQGSASPLAATAVATAGPAADVPYGAALADKILVQLTPEQRSAFLHRYFHISSGVEQVAADMKGNLSPADVAALADVLSEVSALMKKTA